MLPRHGPHMRTPNPTYLEVSHHTPTWYPQVRQALAAEGSSQTTGLTALKQELAGQIAASRHDLGAEMASQLRGMTSDVGDLRRSVSVLADGMQVRRGSVPAGMGWRREEGCFCMRAFRGVGGGWFVFSGGWVV